MGQSVIVDAAGTTSVGREREHNEDQFLIADMARAIRIRASTVYGGKPAWLPTKGQGTLLVVADGMGGLGGGDKASMIAVRTVAKHLANVMPWGEETATKAEAVAEPEEEDAGRKSIPQVRRRLESALHHGAEAIVAAAKGTKNPSMGTTLTAAFMRFPTLYVAHVGDSRAYLVRAGGIRQLTDDHSLVAELLRRQKITEDDAREHPHRHVLTRALGVRPAVEPDLAEMTPLPGDVFVMCSDGLTGHLMDAEIAKIVSATPSLDGAAKALVECANARGGEDNITVVLVRCSS